MAVSVDGLLVTRDSVVHRLPAHVKTVALLATVLAVVLTPAGAWAVLGAQTALVVGAAAAARLPAGLVVRRLGVEVPFVLLAATMPLVASGERTAVGPVALSVPGLLGGATLLVKATTGTLGAVVLASTTRPRDLVAGLERLRLPAVLVAILAFMVRYLGVIADEVGRTRVAREARGGGTTVRARLAAVAGGVGTRFVRTYERGERVQQAMLARGYTGRMPALGASRASLRQWATAGLLPLAAAAALAAGWAVGALPAGGG